MNNVVLMGRLTRDPNIRYADSGVSIARLTLAVDRRFKKEGEQTADFIGCIAFGKTAEFIEKYFSQGKKMAIVGRIQTGNYTNKEGQKVYTTDVVIESAEFVERNDSQSNQDIPVGRPMPSQAATDGFMSIPDGLDEELPFN